jgi:hypothetical protein
MRCCWNRLGSSAVLGLAVILLNACEGDRITSHSVQAPSRTRVLVDGELRDLRSTGAAAASSSLQAASSLGALGLLKPLSLRSTARRAGTSEATWLDAGKRVRQVVSFNARGLPATVQVRTPNGTFVIENEFSMSGNSAELVRQVVKSGQLVLIERATVRTTSLVEVPLTGLYAGGSGIGSTVSACLNGLATILLPAKAYASTLGDPCAAQSRAQGSAHRKAVLGAAAAGATCAVTGGLMCAIALGFELDAIHDAVVATDALEECRSDHPEYVVSPPCTAFCKP